MRYIGWMDVLVRVWFISKKIIVAVGKIKVTTTKEQRTSRVRNDQHRAACTRAHRTAHFTAGRNPAACIYFSAFRRMQFTHSAVVSKA